MHRNTEQGIFVFKHGESLTNSHSNSDTVNCIGFWLHKAIGNFKEETTSSTMTFGNDNLRDTKL